jgi:hypothetical protein
MKVAARNPIAWREKSANCGALLRSTRLSRDEAGPAAAKKNKNTLRRRSANPSAKEIAHGGAFREEIETPTQAPLRPNRAGPQ